MGFWVNPCYDVKNQKTMLYLIGIYFLLFTYLAIKKFPLAVYLFLLTIPTYIIRFNIGPLPSTLLEVSFFALVIGWVVTSQKNDSEKFKIFIASHKRLFVLLVFLLLFSFIGACTSMIGAENPVQKLIYGIGEWRALFFEPILLFAILITRRELLEQKKMILSLVGAAVLVSTIAIIQKFTGLLFPPSLWDDQLFGRVTSIFTSANAIGLFTVPILFLSLLVLKRAYYIWAGVVIILLANVFSISQGAWIAIGAGVLVYLFMLGYKKISIAIAIIGVVGSLVLPGMKEAVLFQDQAGKNRLTVWSHTAEYLIETPKNFIVGSGIRNFYDAIQKPWHNPKTLEPLKYPHNIILNFWTEIGLLGMLSFVGILVSLFVFTFKIKDTQKKAAYIAALTALVVHGLVDVPYFKNDLAMLFWILVFLVVGSQSLDKTK